MTDRRPAGLGAPLLLITLAALLLLLTAVAAAPAGGGYSARVVIVVGKKSSGSATSHRRVVVDDYAGMMAALGQRLEDVVAPELLPGAAGGGEGAYSVLDNNRQWCPKNGCAGKQPGGSYTGRPCSGRVVIVAGKSGRGVVVDDLAGMMAALGQRLEDVVAPELLPGAGGLVVGAGGGGYGALEQDKAACPQKGGCAGKKDGEAYTRPCTYKDQCERP
uniref:Uncharacterized protein n=1 Tax=Oryza punctata TaxID=4537 RepID=A0A0E0MNU3_ORYPU